MLPSKSRPTSSPARFTNGEPELPPTLSHVVTKFSGVARFSLRLRPRMRFGSVNGSRSPNAIARSKSP